jgi:hypothetical protein
MSKGIVPTAGGADGSQHGFYRRQASSSSAREFCTATCSAEGIHDARRFVIHLLIGELFKLIGEGEGVHES